MNRRIAIFVVTLVFPLASLGQPADIQSQTNRPDMGDYVLWRVVPSEVGSLPETRHEDAPLILEQYDLPSLTLRQSTRVRIASELTPFTIGHWGKNLLTAGVSKTTVRSRLKQLLPNMQGLSPNMVSQLGVLAANTNYVFSFTYAPAAEIPEYCVMMGYAKYRLTDLANGRILMDRGFCMQSLEGEFSGFVDHPEYVCYIVDPSYRKTSDIEGNRQQVENTSRVIHEDESFTVIQRILAVKKSGEIVPLHGPPSKFVWLHAKPDRSAVAMLQACPATDACIQVELFNPGLNKKRWTATFDLRHPDFYAFEAYWSADSKLLVILPARVNDTAQLVVIDGEDGRVLLNKANSGFSNLCADKGTLAIVHRSARFQPYAYFMLDERK